MFALDNLSNMSQRHYIFVDKSLEYCKALPGLTKIIKCQFTGNHRTVDINLCEFEHIKHLGFCGDPEKYYLSIIQDISVRKDFGPIHDYLRTIIQENIRGSYENRLRILQIFFGDGRMHDYTVNLYAVYMKHPDSLKQQYK